MPKEMQIRINNGKSLLKTFNNSVGVTTYLYTLYMSWLVSFLSE